MGASLSALVGKDWEWPENTKSFKPFQRSTLGNLRVVLHHAHAVLAHYNLWQVVLVDVIWAISMSPR